MQWKLFCYIRSGTKRIQKKKYYKNLQDEAGDVYCLLQVLIQRGMINEAGLKDREQEKLHKLKKWSKLFEE